MATFLFGTQPIAANDPRFAALLAEAHGAKPRPRCRCTPSGVEMYVARWGDGYLIKRMPDTGSQHDPGCDSFEPPAELSGLGEVLGKAIREDIEDGTTALKLDFSLTRISGRAAATFGSVESEVARTDGTRLTLRGMLHYLWEQAGLNKWTPGMAGKRTWFVVRKYLLQAAADKTARGTALNSMLFIPETFSVEHKEEILARRIAWLAPLAAAVHSTRKLMLLIGEVKQIVPSRYGHKLVVKHLPDLPLMLPEDLHRRLLKRSDTELALWDADASTHLLAVGTFGLDGSGVAAVEELALQLVSANWMPVEHGYEAQLLDALTRAGRRFTKGLRYNLAPSRPVASVVLADTDPKPVAMYVVPPGAGDEYRAELGALVDGSELTPWVWNGGDEPMPDLPPMRDSAPPEREPQRADADAAVRAAHAEPRR